MGRGRKAVLPPGNPPESKSVSSQGSLVVTLILEDNPSYKFDLSRMRGPMQMRAELAQSVVTHSHNSNGVRRISSLKNVSRAVSSLLRWVELWNQDHKHDQELQILSLSDLTPFHLLRYRNHVEAKHTPNTKHVYYGGVTVLLRVAPAASAETRREASRRKGEAPGPVNKVQRYSRTEYTEIRNSARRCIEAAHIRITAAYALSQQADHPGCSDPVRARALQEIIVYGQPTSKEGMLALSRAGRSRIHAGPAAARRHLFLTTAEAFAATVLIACQRGMNLSPIIKANVPVAHEPGVVQWDLDKPRRGPRHRFWPEILVEGDAAGIEGGDGGAKVLRLVEEATEPFREYFKSQGQPTQRLIGYWASTASRPRIGMPHATEARANWVPAGTTIDFRRLRRSVPGQGVAREPSHHSPETHLHYVRSDEGLLMEHREEAARGVEKLVEHSRARLAIRIAEDCETSQANDAVVANCSDPLHRPDTGRPCTTGFYSFLDCLGCSNAASVPRLLPRQIATLRILESLRDSMGEAWERRFAVHHETLVAIVGRHTPIERELAAVDAEQSMASITAALRHEVPK